MKVGGKYQHEERQDSNACDIENNFPLDNEFEIIPFGGQIVKISRPGNIEEMLAEIFIGINKKDRSKAVDEDPAQPAEKIKDSPHFKELSLVLFVGLFSDIIENQKSENGGKGSGGPD